MKSVLKRKLRNIMKFLPSFKEEGEGIMPYQYLPPQLDAIEGIWTKSVIKIAVVGAGKQGRALANAASEIDGCMLVGLCDVNNEILLRAAKEEGFSQDILFTSVDQMLAATAIDLIFVATNAATHSEVGANILSKGCVERVCIEKPIAQNLEQAQVLASLTKGSYVAVNHSRRWSLDYRHILKVIQNGSVGEPISAHICWAGAGMGNIGVHLIDVVRMLCGNPKPIMIQGKLDSPEMDDSGGGAFIEFDNGVHLYLNTSYKLKFPHKRIDLYFEKGSLHIDERAGLWTFSVCGESITYPLQDNGRNKMRAARVLSGIINEDYPASTVQDGIDALTCVLAIKASSETGEIIRAPFAGLSNMAVWAR